MEDGPPSRPPPAPSQNSNQYLSVSPTRGYDQNDGDWEDEWDDASSAASDTYSGDYNFNSSNAPRTMSMARAGTVKKSMNRYVLALLVSAFSFMYLIRVGMCCRSTNGRARL